MHQRGLIETLLHRSFRLCSSYENFHREIETLKSIFKHNNYPQNFVNQCIKKFFLNKLFIKKDLNFGKSFIQSLEWLFHSFSKTHHFTDHAKKNWKNPFCNMRTLW